MLKIFAWIFAIVFFVLGCSTTITYAMIFLSAPNDIEVCIGVIMLLIVVCAFIGAVEFVFRKIIKKEEKG